MMICCLNDDPLRDDADERKFIHGELDYVTHRMNTGVFPRSGSFVWQL